MSGILITGIGSICLEGGLKGVNLPLKGGKAVDRLSCLEILNLGETANRFCQSEFNYGAYFE